MEDRVYRFPLLLLLLFLLVMLEGIEAYYLDPAEVATLQPPKDYYASPSFNSWARYIVAGFGYSFLTVSFFLFRIVFDPYYHYCYCSTHIDNLSFWYSRPRQSS